MHHRCLAAPWSRSSLREAERRANQIVFENRPVTISFQQSSEDLGLRKPTEREGEVRIISIQDLDRSACGGTHVRATGEIGAILLRKLDRIRGNLRIEFLCGGRAVARARADFEALSQIARVFSAPLDDAPALVEAQREKLQAADKATRRLATELAQVERARFVCRDAGRRGRHSARAAPRGIALGGIACRGSKLHLLRRRDFPGVLRKSALDSARCLQEQRRSCRRFAQTRSCRGRADGAAAMRRWPKGAYRPKRRSSSWSGPLPAS